MSEPGAVRVTQESITVVGAGFGSGSVGWDELERVEIETTDEGPFAPDVFWRLLGGTSPVVVIGGSPGEGELLAALQERLDGLDNDAIIEAMSSTDNGRFLVWTNEGGGPLTAVSAWPTDVELLEERLDLARRRRERQAAWFLFGITPAAILPTLAALYYDQIALAVLFVVVAAVVQTWRWVGAVRRVNELEEELERARSDDPD